jgi:hypothetical protein
MEVLDFTFKVCNYVFTLLVLPKDALGISICQIIISEMYTVLITFQSLSVSRHKHVHACAKNVAADAEVPAEKAS